MRRNKTPKPRKKTLAQTDTSTLDATVRAFFARPPEQWGQEWAHDSRINDVTPKRFRSCVDFLRGCHAVARWRLTQGQFPDDASHYIAEVMVELPYLVRDLIEAGDLNLAGRLPAAVNELQRAAKIYGATLSGKGGRVIPIEVLLKKHKARDLIEMLSILYPQCNGLTGIKDWRAVKSLPEEKLREVLLSEECFLRAHDGKEIKERRKHRAAQLIENICAIQKNQGKNVKRFVEYLWQGLLWSKRWDPSEPGPKPAFIKCPWQGDKKLPREDVSGWMKKVMPFLRSEAGNDPMKLGVFRYMVAYRRFAYYDASGQGCGRLANDSPKIIWNQVERELRKAWATMAKQAVKLTGC